ncbi:MAG: hypothetical protein O2894_00805 [Planctomycetota bacterium]|nr:hypothetical protein [Planctomycetota bacterium]
MHQTGLALLLGLIGGAAGAVATMMIGGSSTPLSTSAESTDLSAVITRLDRIEATLGQRPMRQAPGLEGRGPGSAAQPAGDDLDAIVERLEARLRPAIEESVRTSVAAAAEESGGKIGSLPSDPPKKKVTLREAASELGLTSQEEDAVRRIANETTEEFLKLLKDENGTVEDVRREFEEAKSDPVKRAGLTGKYMGRVLGNIGGVMGVVVGHQAKMRQAVGAERADRLEEGYELTDMDPLGLKDAFEFSK